MNWKIPLYNLNIDDKEIDAINKVINSNWLSMGMETKKFEQEFATKLGIPEDCSVAVNSGTAALHTAMHIIGVGPGDEVLVPSLTFVASAACVMMVGAKPVFIDSSSTHDFNLNPSDIISKITKNTKAIIVVHYGGYSSDMEAILKIASEYNLKVIEDVAHGPIVKSKHGVLGTLGDIGCFSFFATKNITTVEGGMLVCRNPKIIEKAKLFRSHCMNTDSFTKHNGRASSYDVNGVGMNYRMTDLAATMGRVQLEKWEIQQHRREEIVTQYRSHLLKIEKIILPYAHVPVKNSSHHIFSLLLNSSEERDRLAEYLRDRGIQTSIHYPPCHLFSYYKENLQTFEGMCPIAEEIGRRQLSLPLYPDLTFDEVNLVCQSIKDFFHEKG
ncbi:DegT/DnrJ/EryC1/StrS family aminotransferase [Cytobacillus oceanisediminis]|uniref:DegT/DnrJ/EryC1/StrS family aminotransferase n=1 Tax=Cytobacillus oceanisediminis TaxID=665099 RepID=UPI001C236B5A|nr:DegT/DnrJ/EryC1/StrS family aminotransferase [Cytobacillus oceanisediminis]MBU8772083.1 DegT/DnrJ/EryC1/StrS family aminotransferase [Cytobacillus oceanisediminis]